MLAADVAIARERRGAMLAGDVAIAGGGTWDQASVPDGTPIFGTLRSDAQMRMYRMLAAMDEIYCLQSEVMKILASPRRLTILHLLADGPREVGRLAEEMGISQPNASQHLAVMRAAGIVEAERDGREVRYRLTDPDVIRACDIMRGVLMRRLARMGQLSERPGVAGDEPAAAGSPATAG